MAPTPPPSGTRQNLIHAGLRLFGQRGFYATSTRALAEEAGTNVASIAYHFGGKEGLRRACADHVAQHIGQVIPAVGQGPLPDDPAAAMDEMAGMVRAFSRTILISPEAGEFVPFVMRELTDPGEIAEILFSGFFLPRHARLCQLWSVVTGRDAGSQEVMLTIFALIGQVLYFRIAQPFVIRRMGWDTLGKDEATRIADTVISNLRAIAERTGS